MGDNLHSEVISKLFYGLNGHSLGLVDCHLPLSWGSICFIFLYD